VQIPILNIYYLLCYAWDKLEEGEKTAVGVSDYKQAIDLFARVLINGCTHLFKRGLDRDYIKVTERYPGVKGKINFTMSLNENLFDQGKSVCEFDEFEHDVLQNQLLKATLLRLSKIQSLDSKLRKEVRNLYLRFLNVQDIEIKLQQFSLVRIHRNNIFYDFLLRLSRMIIEETALKENGDSYLFKDFTRNDKAMAKLFESFVRNFYKKEQQRYIVTSPKISWMATAIGDSDVNLLPEMRTDIVLESSDRKIIIDAKYYSETTSEYFGTKTFHSNNLYQVYSYLRNLEEVNSNILNRNAEGVLLYPSVNAEYDQSYLIGGHKIRLITVDLGRDWREIERRLMGII
jgi:5-methylcytosine-specific restriction enzyme subunit McrC